MIYSLSEKQIPKLSQVGGKAKALMETTVAGFPVPEGLVLSVEFFAPWLEMVKSSEEFKTTLSVTTKENCDILKVIAETLSFTDRQTVLFDKEMSTLEGRLFAVRSSSPEEDLEGTSFAGMYETFLGTTRDHLEKNIAKAFASCFDFRVMAYKKQKGIDLKNTAIAVIVQRQIASDISGVGFSLNPLNNAYDEVFINASFGLGEAIVSGIVTPDSYVFDVADDKIIEKKVNAKEISLWLHDNGGVVEKGNTNKEAQALTDQQIKELAMLIKKCEAHYGKPMDTEWAYENGKLYLLQSRPITTHYHLFEELRTQPGESKRFYIDVMMLTQGFGEPMSVLGLDLWSEMMYHIKLGMFTPFANGTAPAIYGKEYFSMTAIAKSISKAGVGKILSAYDGNIRKIFGEINIDDHPFQGIPEGTKGVKTKILKGGFVMLPGATKAMFVDHNEVINDYLNEFESIIGHAKGITKQDDFHESALAALKNTSKVMTSAPAIFVGMIAQMQVAKMFKGTDGEKDVVTMGMDLDGNPTSEMGYLLFKMADSNDFKAVTSREDFTERADGRLYSEEFLSLYDEFMKKYAVRGFKEIDVASKRIYEDVGMLYDKLIQINVEDNQILNAAQKREAAYERLLVIAKQKGFEKKFIRLSKKHKETSGYREHPKYMVVYLMAILHDLALSLGDDFVAEGRLDDREHIFDFTAEEISKAQKDKHFNLRLAREENLKGYKLIENVKEFPLVIDSRGKIYKPKLEVKDGCLVGDPIASGKVIGKAKVLHSPYEKPLLPGEILIARATEPSWTPIFTNAAGVVMEIGGPLQHGGIIAREYGIPCVSGLIGIMDMVKDGDLLELDGTNGVVKLLD